MNMISQWISGIMLHVSDKNIMPIDQIKRTIGGKFHINGSKIPVCSNDQILSVFRFIPGATIPDFMLLHSQKSYGIIYQHIPLHFFRKMSAGNKFQTRSWSHQMIFFNQLLTLMGRFPVSW